MEASQVRMNYHLWHTERLSIFQASLWRELEEVWYPHGCYVVFPLGL